MLRVVQLVVVTCTRVLTTSAIAQVAQGPSSGRSGSPVLEQSLDLRESKRLHTSTLPPTDLPLASALQSSDEEFSHGKDNLRPGLCG